MRRLILGTGGHIDHGKTALVRALTGIDTDRLPEEKRRGITIDLGFAHLPLDDDTDLSIVDVPGHEAFVRNMLAGASGIDIVLLVVAADEGVMPQTREHLAIVELLGITRGVVALTKADLVDEEWLELVRDDVETLLAPTPLAGAGIVHVSAKNGDGLGALMDALRAAAADVAPRSFDDLFRMPVDRVFTVHGTGTVVTGTVWSGALKLNDSVRLLPSGLTARVRGLQQHGAACDIVAAGARAAIALTGVDRHALERGETLVSAPVWQAASIITASIRTTRDDGVLLKPRQRVRVHLGTAEVLARVALLDREIGANEQAIVQLRLEAPVVARAGDHLVIRSYSPVHTIAGGIVLEPNAPKRKRVSAALAAQLERLPGGVAAAIELAGVAGVRTAELPLLTGLSPARVRYDLASSDVAVVGDRVLPSSFLAALRQQICDALQAYHAAAPLEEGMDRETLRRAAGADGALFDAAMQPLAAAGVVVQRPGGVALSDHRPWASPEDRARLDRLTALYAAAGLEAPDLAELPVEVTAGADPQPLLRFMEREGLLVRVTPVRWTDAAAVRGAVSALRTQLPAGEPLGVAELKGVLQLSRKHLIPLLEYFDRVGVTVRQGDRRVLVPTGRGGAGDFDDTAAEIPQV